MRLNFSELLGQRSPDQLTKYSSFRRNGVPSGSSDRRYVHRSLADGVSGETLAATINGLLKQKTGRPNTTFAELREYQEREKTDGRQKRLRSLVVPAMCLRTQELVWFSYETTPSVSVAAAVRASSALPYIYDAVKMQFNATPAGKAVERACNEENSAREHHLCDAGPMANLPWDAFDAHKVTPHRPQNPSFNPTPPRGTIVAERRLCLIAGIRIRQHGRKRRSYPCVPDTTR